MGVLAMWWERYHQGTSRAVFTFLSPIERVLVASRAIWFYLSKLTWPSNLTFIYPRWDIAPTHLLNYAWLLAGVIVCGAIYFLRQYVGRSVEVAAGFFVATLSPVLGFIMLYTFRSPCSRSLSVACIGPIALALPVWSVIADTFKNSRTLICSAALCGWHSGDTTRRQPHCGGNTECSARLCRNPVAGWLTTIWAVMF